MRVQCPKCHGNYWADPFRKCSNCLRGWVWVQEEKKEAKAEVKGEQSEQQKGRAA